MIGFTSVVIPTPMAQPVIPKPFPCARRSLGKISVGTKNATVPQVAAYLSGIRLARLQCGSFGVQTYPRLNKKSIVTAAGAYSLTLLG